jgi:hypothetical protein
MSRPPDLLGPATSLGTRETRRCDVVDPRPERVRAPAGLGEGAFRGEQRDDQQQSADTRQQPPHESRVPD